MYYGRAGWSLDRGLPGRLLTRWSHPLRALSIQHKWRFLGIAIVNTYSWLVFIVAISMDIAFFQFCFGMLSCHLIAYTSYYVVQKYRHKEKVVLQVWIAFGLTGLFGGIGWWMFTTAVTDKLLTPEQSRLLNKPCVLFNFFDYHDVWHFASAIALFGGM
eukprot:TRINITY_DN2708_c0_g1_i3.p1 TRINITY_DN2708_c0_g1~~TRINITY_DN2708_c0_g1_i3.p1  ORF type:complete len:159 (-),score=26.71 TRINITY_DN2708_c0_g1_i3:429-905(-)